MPTLVHLADERNLEKIRKNGLKPNKKGLGVYAMPVGENFYFSHQWLRELKSTGTRTIIGVYFKIDSNEMVFAGKYNQNHQNISVSEAIRQYMDLKDPLGFELIIPKKIDAGQIIKIKHLPQLIGWRHFPGSNNVSPCDCEFCLRGTIKGRKTINRLKNK